MTQGASLSLVGTSDAGAQNARRQLVPLSELAIANRQRDALYLLSEQLHRANSLQEIYDAAMDGIESALGCDRSAILLFDDAGVMQFVASRGLSDEYRRAVTGHSPWKSHEADAVPIDIPDVESADLDENLKATVLREGIRATAFVPLVSDGALIGKFMGYFREPYVFTQRGYRGEPGDFASARIFNRAQSHATPAAGSRRGTCRRTGGDTAASIAQRRACARSGCRGAV